MKKRKAEENTWKEGWTMAYKGPLAYDEAEFLKAYLARRNRKDSPNNAIEGPVMDELLGSVTGTDILDLGCGDGRYGRELLDRGLKHYTGVEGSAAMHSLAAEELSGPEAEIILSTIEEFDFPESKFDNVVSRLAIHYVEDIHTLFASIRKSLKKDGKFVFSVQHPLTTSSFKSKSSGERKGDWLVDDYFQQGPREEPWMGKSIVKYHRTIEAYYSALLKAGFQVDALKEGEPSAENFSSSDEFERRKRIPVVLIFSCSIR